MVIFSSVRLGVSPQINALASLFVLAAAILVTGASWFLRRQERVGG
jgi:putrescine transport system permease protein